LFFKGFLLLFGLYGYLIKQSMEMKIRIDIAGTKHEPRKKIKINSRFLMNAAEDATISGLDDNIVHVAFQSQSTLWRLVL
jgi:hypothetical protein